MHEYFATHICLYEFYEKANIRLKFQKSGKGRFLFALCPSPAAGMQNFGWAPQRFNSRARPLAREARPCEDIFKTLVEEAQWSSTDKRVRT